MVGSCFDPVKKMTNEQKMVLTTLSDNQFRLTLYSRYGHGAWFKYMDGTYTRAKS
jgi:hypothetical protein